MCVLLSQKSKILSEGLLRNVNGKVDVRLAALFDQLKEVFDFSTVSVHSHLVSHALLGRSAQSLPGADIDQRRGRSYVRSDLHSVVLENSSLIVYLVVRRPEDYFAPVMQSKTIIKELIRQDGRLASFLGVHEGRIQSFYDGVPTPLFGLRWVTRTRRGRVRRQVQL